MYWYGACDTWLDIYRSALDRSAITSVLGLSASQEVEFSATRLQAYMYRSTLLQVELQHIYR